MRFLPGGILFITVVLFSCTMNTNLTLNDFFGIQMRESEQKVFRIVSYEPDKGASYFKTEHMNPEIYAWAELNGKDIDFKVVNSSKSALASNYLLDQFSITLKTGETFIIDKGRAIDYPVRDVIGAGSDVSFVFVIPTKFWETIGMTKPQSVNESYTKDFWAGLNTANTYKDNIDRITILLNGETRIVLKVVPQSIHEKD